MLEGIKSIKATQPQKFRNAVATPPKGIEIIYSVFFYNAESHQSLYLKEIFI